MLKINTNRPRRCTSWQEGIPEHVTDRITSVPTNLSTAIQGVSTVFVSLKGLGHAISGNFSTDQIVIELT